MTENQTTLVRFGIMGCARIARKISRAIKLAPNSTLHAIASRSLEKAEAFATQNGLLDDQGKLIKIYGSYIELLDDPLVDAVYMPLPTSLHVEWAVLAASKKKHLLLEKPTALDIAQLDQILEACEINGVQFMDGTMWYHHPRTAKMKQTISNSADFGHIRMISCTSSFRANPDFLDNNIRVNPECDALGALGDLGWYCIGLILWSVNYKLPAFMIQEFARLVMGIKSHESCSDKMWPEISRKTQLALDAIRKSIDLGYKPVYI